MAMAEANAQLKPWAYKPSDNDSSEIKEAAYLEENIEVTRVDISGKLINNQDCTVVIDLDSSSCVINGKDVRIRCCQLMKEPGKDEKSVKISIRIGNEYYRFSMFFETVNDTLKVMNICRRILHSAGVVIDYLSPLWEGVLQVEVVSISTNPAPSSDRAIPSYSVVLDGEALFLYEDSSSDTPKYYLQFYKEATEHSMEKAIVQHALNVIVLESSKTKFVISNESNHTVFSNLLKNVKPKPASVFETYKALGSYTSGRFKESSSSSSAYQTSMTDPHSSRLYLSSKRSDDHLPPPTFRTESPHREQRNQAAIIAGQLNAAVAEYSTKEELSLQWIVAEEEIKDLLSNTEGLGDSENDMLSGGLDPNNPDHLMRSFDEIKELISKQRYDMALCRLRGTKTIFQESSIREIQSLVIQDDVELMKKLYYHSFA